MKIVCGNATSAKGFKAAGGFIGLKKAKKDMALILSDVCCKAAGCFTTNVVKAAPVVWDMSIIKNDIKGIVVNSGNANACTGKQGLEDAKNTAEKFAQLSKVNTENILVCSTGVIGVNLPMDKIKCGIENLYPLLSYDAESGNNAAEAIMTTDTVLKTACAEIDINGKKVTIGAMAKGCGMINPNMATMLCFITTDANITRQLLDKALHKCVEDTFNMICVDGDTSTNDTIIVLANGMAENDIIDKEDENYYKFEEALFEINKKLAMSCASDGEGATKFMEVTVDGAKTKKDAALMARAVVSSNLFKAALFGEDANWGRALCAMGYSGADFDPDKVTIYFRSKKGEIMLMDNGVPEIFDEDLASLILSEHDINIDIQLKDGNNKATAWGCDLTYDYVKINGEYRS